MSDYYFVGPAGCDVAFHSSSSCPAAQQYAEVSSDTTS